MKKLLSHSLIVAVALIMVGLALELLMHRLEISIPELKSSTKAKGAIVENGVYYVKSNNRPIKNDQGIMDEMVRIPAGEIWADCDKNDPSCINFVKKTRIAAFELDRYEVLLDDYLVCVRAKGCSQPRTMPFWRGPWMPVAGVDWFQSSEYCRWAAKRLPAWEEWLLAARGPGDGNIYPWGDEWDPKKANWCDSTDWKEKDRSALSALRNREGRSLYDPYPACEGIVDGFRHAAPVNAFPDGVSDYGVFNMCGNQREWTSTPTGPVASNERDQNYSMGGGAWGPEDNRVGLPDTGLLSDMRGADPAHYSGPHIGFRCARSIEKH